MKIILYNNYSENNKLNKTIVKIVEMEGYLRDQTSLINPQVLIEFHPDQFDGYVRDNDQDYVVVNGLKVKWDSFVNNYVLSANYVSIPDFNRFYFINDIVSVRQNLWRILLHVDVLMSYSKEILNTKGFIARNEFTFDPMVRDDEVSYYYDKDVNEYIPNKGDLVNLNFSSSTNPLYDNIIITCINDQISSNTDNVTSPIPSLPNVSGVNSGDSATYKTYAIFPASLSMLSKRIVRDNALATFILSIVAYPFLLDVRSSSLGVLRLGTTDIEDDDEHTNAVYVSSLTKNLSKYNIIADFTISGDSFMDYEPYTQYEIYLPYLGWISLSADVILNNRLIVYYIINYQTGLSQVNIYDVTHDKIIYTTNTQLGIRIPITSTNAREVNDQHNSNNIGLGVGLLTGVMSTIGGIATYNPIAIGGGLIAMGSSIAKYVQNENTNYQKASGSVGSGQSGLYLPQDVKIRITRLKPKDYNEDYFKLRGKPLNKIMQLKDLSGFTIVGDEHLENFGSATKGENDEIKSLLNTGVIL